MEAMRDCCNGARGQQTEMMPGTRPEAVGLQRGARNGQPGFGRDMKSFPGTQGNGAESATIQKAAELAGSTGWSAKDTMNIGRDVLFVLSALVAQGFFVFKT